MCSPSEEIIQKIEEESRVEMEAYCRKMEKWGMFWVAISGAVCALILTYLLRLCGA